MRFVRGGPVRLYNCEPNLGWFDKLFVKVRGRADGLNQWMFEEDFARIYRHSNGGSCNLFNIDTNNDKLAQRLLQHIQTRHDPWTTDKTLSELVEDVARSLISYGKAFYYLHDDDDKEETHVVRCSSENILEVAGCVVQYLPKGVERNWHLGDVEQQRELRILNKKKTLCFRLPVSIRRKIVAQNKILAALDKHDGATSLMFRHQITHQNPNPQYDFDFNQWRGARDLALYKATRQTGWNARKYDSQERSDFFYCHRLIRFRRNQLILRDNILSQLSIELKRVGRHYRDNFRIEISTTEALPSVSHLNDLEVRLSHEETEFSEVIDYYFKR